MESKLAVLVLAGDCGAMAGHGRIVGRGQGVVRHDIQGRHVRDYEDEDDHGDLHLRSLRGTKTIKLKVPSFDGIRAADKYFD